MKIKIDQERKILFLSVGYPTNMGIPHFMQKHYPEFAYRILTYKSLTDWNYHWSINNQSIVHRSTDRPVNQSIKGQARTYKSDQHRKVGIYIFMQTWKMYID